MELTAEELSQRCTQEGIQYTIESYFSRKDFKTIKNKRLKIKTFELINALESFKNALEEARWEEITQE